MRNVFLSLFLAAITIPSLAQKRTAQLGIKAGLNIADFSDDISTTDSRVGFHGGLLIHVHVQPKLAIQPEIVYSQQGAEFSGGKLKLDYVNIPVLFQYLFSNGFRLQTGPQIGILANSEYKSNNGVEIDTDGFKKTDAAWAFGFSYVSTSGLGVDARYNLGFSDITKDNPDVMNRVWQFGMFYQFP